MGLGWTRQLSSSSSGPESSNSGATEDQQPQFTDLTGDDAAESVPELIDPTCEDSEDPPGDSLRIRPRGRCHQREHVHRARTERNRSRSRSPLRSTERPEREDREWEERQSTIQQVQRERDGSSNFSPLRSSERPDRSRYRSRSPLRSPQTPEREGMSRPNEERVRDFSFGDTQQRDTSNDVHTRFVEEQDPEGDCSICLMEFETWQRVTTPKCGHEFHHQCLLRWIKENPSCPICRYRFTNLRRGRCVRVMAIAYNCTRNPNGTWRSVRLGKIVN